MIILLTDGEFCQTRNHALQNGTIQSYELGFPRPPRPHQNVHFRPPTPHIFHFEPTPNMSNFLFPLTRDMRPTFKKMVGGGCIHTFIYKQINRTKIYKRLFCKCSISETDINIEPC